MTNSLSATRPNSPAAGSRRLRVLFVDDEASLREFMRTELPRLGHEVIVAEDGRSAVQILERATFDAAILDLRMPGMSGLEVLEFLKRTAPDTEAIVMTGHASIETATMAMRLGAADYMTKPCKLADIEAVLTRIAERIALKNKNLALETRIRKAEGPTALIGSSPAMAQAQQLLMKLAPTDATVLILGETGCGKELAARTLWQHSHRASAPFIPVNCGAFTEQLVESELFGHRKGAFSGADKDHKGILEVADGGTVFLDEVGELPLNLQVKLLRFLEAKEIRRVGDSVPIKTDVRVLCATHRDLRAMIREGTFREDLYFRINMFEVRLPSLRERREDIPELAYHLLARAARRPVDQVMGLLSPEVLRALENHDWPGNVRELANAMEHAWILSGGKRISPEHLPHLVRRATPATVPLNASTHTPANAAKAAPSAPASSATERRTLEDVEMEHLLRTLERLGGNKTLAAAELGISLKTLYNKLNKLAERRAAS